MMMNYIKFGVLLYSLLPVVFPCIFASELFLYDASRENTDISKDVVIGKEQDSTTTESVTMEEAMQIQQEWLDKRRKEKEDHKPKKEKWSVSFIHAFAASISFIIVSELGDKTFFIAAIMAMRHPRAVVFIGAIGALALMTVLASFLGYATTVIPRKYTFYISTALFAIFGLKMLKEGYEMDPNHGQEEYEEVSVELKKKDEEFEKQKNSSTVQDLETGISRNNNKERWFQSICSPILLQSFTMTFLAEWGDRSQLTTIMLASRDDPFGVTLGGTIGHALCTGLAVIGGRIIAQKISVRTVTLVGGVVFILFALSAFFFDPNKVID